MKLTSINILNYSLHKEYITIEFTALSSRSIISDFLNLLEYAADKKLSTVFLDFTKYDGKCFPNVMLPIKGIIDYYTSQVSFTFNFLESHSKPEITQELQKKSSEYYPRGKSLINHIIHFRNTDNLNQIIQNVFDYLQETFTFPPGLLEGANWALSEVMDNVLQHSSSSHSYVMMQLQKSKKKLIFTIYDNGIGIFNSLRSNEEYHDRLKTHLEAIKLSTEENITRNSKIGAGFGLNGLKKIILENDGLLRMTSGSASIIIDKKGFKEHSNLKFLSYSNLTTLVEVELKYDSYINLHNVFGGDYTPFDYVKRENEKHENKQGTHILIKLQDHGNLRTRKDGEKLRNYVVNQHCVQLKPVIIDFSLVASKITSSFIDEFIAKLFDLYGMEYVQKNFSIDNAEDFVRLLIEQTLANRMRKTLSSLLT